MPTILIHEPPSQLTPHGYNEFKDINMFLSIVGLFLDVQYKGAVFGKAVLNGLCSWQEPGNVIIRVYATIIAGSLISVRR